MSESTDVQKGVNEAFTNWLDSDPDLFNELIKKGVKEAVLFTFHSDWSVIKEAVEKATVVAMRGFLDDNSEAVIKAVAAAAKQT